MPIICPSMYIKHTIGWLHEARAQRRGQAKDINLEVSAYGWYLRPPREKMQMENGSKDSVLRPNLEAGKRKSLRKR